MYDIVAKTIIHLTILEAVVLGVMPYHSSKIGFPIWASEGTSENSQDELNSSFLHLVSHALLSSWTVLVSATV